MQRKSDVTAAMKNMQLLLFGFAWQDSEQYFHTIFISDSGDIYTSNPFKPEYTTAIFTHYKPRIAVALLNCTGWRWHKVGGKWERNVSINTFPWQFLFKNRF